MVVFSIFMLAYWRVRSITFSPRIVEVEKHALEDELLVSKQRHVPLNHSYTFLFFSNSAINFMYVP